jgi:hypothetical protein
MQERSMRSIFVLGPLLLLAAAAIGVGGPVTGVSFQKKEIDENPWIQTRRFTGGERAAVLVRGSNHAGAGLHLTVHDANGKLVAEDKGKDPPVPDMVAVFWYPPRDAEYRIEIRNLDSRANECYITVK